MKLRRKSKSIQLSIIIAASLISLVSQNCLAIDFSDARRSFQKDMASEYGPNVASRIAIVYNTSDQNQIKYKINLVKFKKELSRELLKSFEVVDPLIVQEIISTNQIAFNQLTEDDFILKSFAERADCTQVLLVDLKALNASVLANLKLITPTNDTLSQVVMDIPHEGTETQTIEKTPPVEEEEESVIDRIASDYKPSTFDDNHNESWMFFAPTAYINPKKHYLDLLTWVDNLSEMDFKVVRVRYDIKPLEDLQLGIEVNSIQDKINARSDAPNTENSSGIHSGYMSARYQVLDEEDLPVVLLLGIKGRVYWDKYNTDFESGDDARDSKNDSYNKATVLAAVSGKWQAVGLLYNFYLDNQTFSMGAKYLITSNIKLYAEDIFYYYEEPQVPNDFSIGIQAYNSAGVITTLCYQKETDQIQLGLSFSW